MAWSSSHQPLRWHRSLLVLGGNWFYFLTISVGTHGQHTAHPWATPAAYCLLRKLNHKRTFSSLADLCKSLEKNFWTFAVVLRIFSGSHGRESEESAQALILTLERRVLKKVMLTWHTIRTLPYSVFAEQRETLALFPTMPYKKNQNLWNYTLYHYMPHTPMEIAAPVSVKGSTQREQVERLFWRLLLPVRVVRHGFRH